MAKADLPDRNLATARELRAAAEETRQVLQTSRDLVERSRRQTQSMIPPKYEPVVGIDHSEPSKPLVECLIQAYELTEADGEPQTRALLGRVLTHVGRRIAMGFDPRAAKTAMH